MKAMKYHLQLVTCPFNGHDVSICFFYNGKRQETNAYVTCTDLAKAYGGSRHHIVNASTDNMRANDVEFRDFAIKKYGKVILPQKRSIYYTLDNAVSLLAAKACSDIMTPQMIQDLVDYIYPKYDAFKNHIASQPHIGVTCSACGALDFSGIRYKCIDCPNWDMCAPCYGQNMHHDISHKYDVIYATGPFPAHNTSATSSASSVVSLDGSSIAAISGDSGKHEERGDDYDKHEEYASEEKSRGTHNKLEVQVEQAAPTPVVGNVNVLRVYDLGKTRCFPRPFPVCIFYNCRTHITQAYVKVSSIPAAADVSRPVISRTRRDNAIPVIIDDDFHAMFDTHRKIQYVTAWDALVLISLASEQNFIEDGAGTPWEMIMSLVNATHPVASAAALEQGERLGREGNQIPPMWPDKDAEYLNAVRVIMGHQFVDYPLAAVDHRLELFALPPSHKAYGSGYNMGVKSKAVVANGTILGYYAGLVTGNRATPWNAYVLDSNDKTLDILYDAYSCGNEMRQINANMGITLEPNAAFGDDVHVAGAPEWVTARPIYTLRPIMPGEEITLDYGTAYWNRLEQQTGAPVAGHTSEQQTSAPVAGLNTPDREGETRVEQAGAPVEAYGYKDDTDEQTGTPVTDYSARRPQQEARQLFQPGDIIDIDMNYADPMELLNAHSYRSSIYQGTFVAMDTRTEECMVQIGTGTLRVPFEGVYKPRSTTPNAEYAPGQLVEVYGGPGDDTKFGWWPATITAVDAMGGSYQVIYVASFGDYSTSVMVSPERIRRATVSRSPIKREETIPPRKKKRKVQ